MKYDQYISLIQELEKSAAKNRGLYQFKIFLLTALGYAYFIGLLLLFVVPIPIVGLMLIAAPEQIWRLLLFGAKLWWVLVPGLAVYFGFIGAALKAITAKVPDPDGTELKRSQAPELFEFIDRTCAELKAKRPAKVLITDSFNAAVATMPRFGIFGQKVFLLLGLPLMKALSAEQFEAVLAHEIGHISGKHGAFAKWAYQMREAWGRLIESQDETDHKFSSLYKKFVDWYFPYFTAYSFVMMREHEKDADREAAQLVGARPLGEALPLMEAKGRNLEDDFWREVHKENLASDTPTRQIFTRMLNSLSFVSDDKAVLSISKAVAVPTDFDDTHPSLADRLRLLGYWTSGDLPALPDPVENDAPTLLLGKAADEFATQFDSLWDEQAGKTWKERHDHFQGTQERIIELEEKRSSGELSLEEIRELGQLLIEKDGYSAAIPLVEEAAERFPEDGVTLFNLGVARLFQEDERGLADLEKAVELDKSLKYEAGQIAFDFLRSKGRLDEAKKYASVIDEQGEVLEKAQKERAAAYPTDTFEKHDLPQDFIDSIPRKLSGLDEIRSIYVVHKVVEHFPESPYRVLLVEIKSYTKSSGQVDTARIFEIIVDRLNTGDIHYFAVLDANWLKAQSQLDSIPGARIYHQPGE